jgi:tetratricopeptide (TPR) repeat protein
MRRKSTSSLARFLWCVFSAYVACQAADAHGPTDKTKNTLYCTDKRCFLVVGVPRNSQPQDTQSKIDALKRLLETTRQARAAIADGNQDALTEAVFVSQLVKAFGGMIVRLAGDLGDIETDNIVPSPLGWVREAYDAGDATIEFWLKPETLGQKTVELGDIQHVSKSAIDPIRSRIKALYKKKVITKAEFERTWVNLKRLERVADVQQLLTNLLNIVEVYNKNVRGKSLVEANWMPLIAAILTTVADVVEKNPLWQTFLKIQADLTAGFGEVGDAFKDLQENRVQDRVFSVGLGKLDQAITGLNTQIQSLQSAQQLEVSPILANKILLDDWSFVRNALKGPKDSHLSNVITWLFATAMLYTGDTSRAANVYSELGGVGAAEPLEQWARSLLSLRGHSPVADLLLGDAFVREGKYSDALQTFNRGIEEAPDYRQLLNARGSLYTLMQATRAADDDFRRAFPGSYQGCGGIGEPPCMPPDEFPCNSRTPHPCGCNSPGQACYPPPLCPPSICGGGILTREDSGRCPDGSRPPCHPGDDGGPNSGSGCADGSKPPCHDDGAGRGGIYMRVEKSRPKDLDFSGLSGSPRAEHRTELASGLTKPTLIYSNLPIGK